MPCQVRRRDEVRIRGEHVSSRELVGIDALQREPDTIPDECGRRVVVVPLDRPHLCCFPGREHA
jgi:hypothetical protein